MQIPELLKHAISEAGIGEVDRWWSGLEPAAREDVLKLWYDCSNPSVSGTPGHLPLVRVEGEFVAAEQGLPDENWRSDYYEFLVNHELYLLQKPGYHICTAEPAARAAAQRGLVPADFKCPAANPECPMRKTLSLCPGKSLRLRLGFIQES